jgi:hypothetical protein
MTVKLGCGICDAPWEIGTPRTCKCNQQTVGYKFKGEAVKNSIAFLVGSESPTEVLRLSREGITANPDIPVDEAAKAVLDALDANIKVMVQKAVEAEREACAQIVENYALGYAESTWAFKLTAAIRGRT